MNILITINGAETRLDEAEARRVHAELDRVFRTEPPKRDWIPSPWWTPGLTPNYVHPPWKDNIWFYPPGTVLCHQNKP